MQHIVKPTEARWNMIKKIESANNESKRVPLILWSCDPLFLCSSAPSMPRSLSLSFKNLVPYLNLFCHLKLLHATYFVKPTEARWNMIEKIKSANNESKNIPKENSPWNIVTELPRLRKFKIYSNKSIDPQLDLWFTGTLIRSLLYSSCCEDTVSNEVLLQLVAPSRRTHFPLTYNIIYLGTAVEVKRVKVFDWYFRDY